MALDHWIVREFHQEDLALVKRFTDRWIGLNYYSINELRQIQNQSCLQGRNASLLAFDKDYLIGMRLTLAPGVWMNNHKQVSPDLWKLAPNKVAYFKSLFVDERYRSQKLGMKLSEQSLTILKEMGAEAVLTHSWLESPANSSQEYLQKAGFIELARYPKFWNHIDYLCVRCAPNRCVCTGVEMIKYLENI